MRLSNSKLEPTSGTGDIRLMGPRSLCHTFVADVRRERYHYAN